MTSFLFWNTNRKPIQNNITKLAHLYQVDIVMLAECRIEATIMLSSLNTGYQAKYHYIPKIGCEKIEIFTTFRAEYIKPIIETDRVTIRNLRLPGLVDILLVIAHFPSKLHWSEKSQSFETLELANLIRSAEKQIGHSRTVLVGDLNMNPFEDGVVSANGLHGVMTEKIAARKVRTVQSRSYEFFYNPMWRFLGNESGPAGTYYYTKNEHITFFWNTYDQVLIRPSIISYFDSKSLSILHSDGANSFLKKDGTPNEKTTSDHLPIYFKLDI